MTRLELWGQGVLLASLGLPVLWLLARGDDTEPASRHRRLVLALGFANLLLLAPQLWARVPGVGGRPAEALQAFVTAAPSGQVEAERPPSVLSVLALVWLLCSAVVLLRTVIAAWRLRRLIKNATPLALPQTPPVLESSEITVPCVASAWNPVILLPRGLRARLTEAQFDCVLAHERHHVARRDPEWALLVALLRVPLTMHPVTRRLLADLSLAREEAVDALIAHEDATAYASALVEVAAHASVGSGFPDAVFMSAHALSRRVDMLMNPRPLRSARLTPVLVAALLLGTLAISASPAKAAEPKFTTDAVVLAPMAPISVRVGTDTILSFPGVVHSQIGDPRLADVCTLTEGRIHVNGLALGSTTLTIWTEKGDVTYPIWIDL